MTEWFRSWHGAPTDPKWLGIARRAGVVPGIAVAVAWALMDRASQAEDRGSIDGYDADGLACFYGCEPDQIDAIVAAMMAKEIIVDGRFASWEKRQPKREDDSSQRVRQHRERAKQQSQRDVTQCNAPDTDTETERKRPEPSVPRASAEPNAPISDFPSQSFDAFWNAYPNRKGKDAARKSFDRVRRGGEVTFDALMAAIDAYKRFKPPDREWCHPATWLNQGRWNDDWTTESTRRLPQQPPARRSGADALMAALTAELGGSDDRGLEHGRASRTDFSGGPIVDLEPLGPTRSVVGSRQ